MSAQPRLSVHINDETVQAIRELAERHNISYTELVRRAIGTYKFFSDEHEAGRGIQTMSKNGNRKRDVFIF